MGRGRRYLSTTKNHKSNESMEIRKIFSSILVSTTEYTVGQDPEKIDLNRFES